MNAEEDKFRTLKYRHNRIVSFFTMPIGAWPIEKLNGKLPFPIWMIRKILPILNTLIVASQIYYIAYNMHRLPFFELGHLYINTFIATVGGIRDCIPLFKAHGELAQKFYTTFDLEHFKHKGPNYEQISSTVYKISYYYAQMVMVFMLSGMALYNVIPMFKNYKSGVFSNLPHIRKPENENIQYSVYFMIYPGFNQDDHFWKVSFLNLFCTYIASIPICIIDLFLTLLVLHIIGHLKILQKNMEDIKMPRTRTPQRLRYGGVNICLRLFDTEENRVINTKLIEFIEHHKFIVTFTDEVSSLFGPILAATYLFHLIGCCLLLLECSQLNLDALAQYGPLTVIIFSELIQLSVLFEFLSTESDKLSSVVYNMPWECMDIRNQKSLCIFLLRVQKPLNVRALGLAEVGVRTMAGILKTTISYFAFLRSMT